MRSPKINIIVLLIILLSFSSSFESNNKFHDKFTTSSKFSNKNSSFSFSNSKITFKIDQTGKYFCEFILEFIGDPEMNNSLSGTIILNIGNASNLQLFIDDYHSLEYLPNNVSFINCIQFRPPLVDRRNKLFVPEAKIVF